jgi:hypothetical protein
MSECLKLGTWDCLVKGQFGGLPVFQMYAPLYFVVAAGLWLMVGKIVSLAFVMKGLVFIGVLSIAPALWYFARAFLGRSAARWTMALSPIFIFYPYALAVFGIGAGGSFLVGLVPAAFGIPLVFFWLGALKEMTDEPRLGRAWWTSLVLGAALALMHTMSLIFGSVLAGLLFLYRGADRGALRRFVGVGLATVGVTAFWLLPFAKYSRLSPGVPIPDIPIAWWEAILPWRVEMGWPLAIFIAVATLAGVYLAVRRQAWVFLTMFGGAWLFFFSRLFLNTALPELVIHYYRFLAFLAALGLVSSGLAVSWLWETARAANKRNGWYVACGVAIVVMMSAFLLMSDYREATGRERVLDAKVIWEPSELPGYEAIGQLTSVMAKEGNSGRIAVEAPGLMSSFVYGSDYFLAAVLQFEQGRSMSNGLYSETGTLAPFLLSAQNELTAGYQGLRVKEYIRLIKAYRAQPTASFLGRLADLGVTHQVFISPEKAELVRATGVEDEVASTPDFAVFRARAARPLVSAADHKPLVFLSAYGNLAFRDLAMALFAGERTYDTLVVEEDRRASEWPEAALAQERFGGVIVDAGCLDGAAVGEIESLKLPVIYLNRSAQGDGCYGEEPTFEAMNAATSMEGRKWPKGWEKLWEDVAKLREANLLPSAAAPQLLTDDRKQLEFMSAGTGPVVINYGYFPSWHVTAGATGIYRVTPDRLLVYPDGTGTVRLQYGGSTLQRASLAVTAVTSLGLAALAWHLHRSRRQGK